MRLVDAAALLVEVAEGAYFRPDERFDVDASVRVVAAPGRTATSDWCWAGCSTVYVRLDTAFPSTAFPTPAAAAETCAARLAARFHVGVYRCVAGLDSQGNPPSAADQTADAFAIMDDAERLRCAITAAVRPVVGARNMILGSWTPDGVDGDCAGGYWPVTLRL